MENKGRHLHHHARASLVGQLQTIAFLETEFGVSVRELVA